MFKIMYYYFSKLCGSINDCELQIKEDLKDNTDEIFFDARSGSDRTSIDTNISIEQQFKSIEELYREEVKKQESEEIQLFRCEGCWRASLEQIYQNNIMRELLGTVQKLQKKVDEKQQFDIGKKDHHEDPRILNVLNTLSKNTDDIKNQMSSIERNIEKLKNKYGILKTRITNLEKESLENSMKIIGIDYSHRMPLWTKPNFDEREVVKLADNYLNQYPPNAYYQQHIIPRTSADFMQTGSSPVHLISRSPPQPHLVTPANSVIGPPPPPPPPPSPATAVFVPPPPPPPPATKALKSPSPPPSSQMTIGTTFTESRNKVQAPAANFSPAVAPETIAQKTYSRIVITEELLKSVVLKPPGQRKAGNRVLTKN